MRDFTVPALTLLIACLSAPSPAQIIDITNERIRFSDGTQLSTAPMIPSAHNVTVTAVIDDPASSGLNLLSVVAAIQGATDRSAAFPYSITLEPGTYDVGAAGVNLPDFVNLRGAGMDATTLSGNPTTGTTPVLQTNGSGVIGDLTVTHTGAAGTSGRAVIAGGAGMRFQSCRISVTGSFNSGATLTAFSTSGGCKVVAVDCVVEVDASSTAATATGVAVSSSPSTFTADGLEIWVQPALTPAVSLGVWTSGSDDVEISNTNIVVDAGSSFTSVVFASGTTFVRIRNSRMETAGGATAMSVGTTPVRVLSSQIIGTRSGSNLILRNCVDGNFNPIP